jgi:hypothetical protein
VSSDRALFLVNGFLNGFLGELGRGIGIGEPFPEE